MHKGWGPAQNQGAEELPTPSLHRHQDTLTRRPLHCRLPMGVLPGTVRSGCLCLILSGNAVHPRPDRHWRTAPSPPHGVTARYQVQSEAHGPCGTWTSCPHPDINKPQPKPTGTPVPQDLTASLNPQRVFVMTTVNIGVTKV